MKAALGQWVRVIYDDIGARDGIVVTLPQHSATGEYQVFSPFEGTDTSVARSQIVAVGDIVTAKESGL